MRYKIGDVSKILGISSDLLRYYEKKGVVTPVKDKENDYRYYDFWDINFLLDCLWFKSFGFSLVQISDMVKFGSFDSLETVFNEKEDEIRAYIERGQLLLKRAEEYRENIQKAESGLGVCDICESPDYYRYINRYTDTYDSSAEMRKLSQDWLELMPFTHRCFEIATEDLISDNGRNYAWGLSLSKEYVNLMNVSTTPPVVHIEPHKSLHSVFSSTGKGNFSPQQIRYMVDYCIEHNLEICGPARGNLLCSIQKDNGLTGFFEVWIPINEK